MSVSSFPLLYYLSCNKTLQGKCGYDAEAEAEAPKRCQVIISAVVLKYVSWKKVKKKNLITFGVLSV